MKITMLLVIVALFMCAISLQVFVLAPETNMTIQRAITVIIKWGIQPLIGTIFLLLFVIISCLNMIKYQQEEIKNINKKVEKIIME